MGTTFTPIVAGTDLQAVSLINEIVQALRNRLYPLTFLMEDAVAGEDMQASARVTSLHSNIEWYCLYYGEGAVRFTLATFRAAAGLRSDGFRRATVYVVGTNVWTNNADPMFSAGPPQAGDVIGPWLWVDLQRAVNALEDADYIGHPV